MSKKLVCLLLCFSVCLCIPLPSSASKGRLKLEKLDESFYTDNNGNHYSDPEAKIQILQVFDVEDGNLYPIEMTDYVIRVINRARNKKIIESGNEALPSGERQVTHDNDVDLITAASVSVRYYEIYNFNHTFARERITTIETNETPVPQEYTFETTASKGHSHSVSIST